MLCLDPRWSRVPIVCRNPLLGRRLMLNAARPPVEGNVTVPCHKAAVHGRAIFIDMAAPCSAHAHMHHCSVVGEDAALPDAAGKTDATIAESVVHATIETNMRAPIAVIEHEHSVVPAPVTRRPKRADVGRRHPRSWYPEVAVRPVTPIPRRPHQTWIGADRLFVDRQPRRSKPDADKDSRARRHGDDANKQS